MLYKITGEFIEIITIQSLRHQNNLFFYLDDEATRAAHEQTSLVFMWGSGVTSPEPLELPKTDHIIHSVCAGKTKKLGLTSYGRVVSWEVRFYFNITFSTIIGHPLLNAPHTPKELISLRSLYRSILLAPTPSAK